MKVQNNLAELRQKRGLGAADLAAQIGVSRQTVYSIEAGSYVPNTLVALKIASVLGVQVEDLFQMEAGQRPAQYADNVEVLPGEHDTQPGQPVQLCRVGKHLVAACPEPLNWNLPPADAVFVNAGRSAKAKGKATVQLLYEEKEFSKRVMVAGCDPGISVLSRHVQRAGVELVVVNRNSSQSLDHAETRARAYRGHSSAGRGHR